MHFTLCTEIMLHKVFFFFLMLDLKYLFALCAATKHTHTHKYLFDLKNIIKHSKRICTSIL